MDSKTWNQIIEKLPGASILQTWEWGANKEKYGWKADHLTWRDENGEIRAAALVLERSVRLGGIGPAVRVLYVPRGPLLDWQDATWREKILDELQALAKKRHAIFIKMDPEFVLGRGIPAGEDDWINPAAEGMLAALKARGWVFSNEQIQFRNTVMLDLSGTEEDWLARMKQKARYNLRLAMKKDVKIRVAEPADFPMLYRMYAETSLRDGFVIRPETYYTAIWQTYDQNGMAKALIAEVDGEAIAGVFVFMFAGRAWYIYGMSTQNHRERMPNYLLQFEAMRVAKENGCDEYDLWGAPDIFNEEDSMWGVFRFKDGLGGKVVRTLGAWDFPAQKLVYPLYTRILPKILDWMRNRGKARTRREMSV